MEDSLTVGQLVSTTLVAASLILAASLAQGSCSQVDNILLLKYMCTLYTLMTNSLYLTKLVVTMSFAIESSVKYSEIRQKMSDSALSYVNIIMFFVSVLEMCS